VTTTPCRSLIRGNWTRLTGLLIVLGCCGAPGTASGQDVTSKAVAPQLEQELATVREDLRKAFNNGDLELLLSYCHPQVIATWPNGDVAVGHDGVRKIIDTLVRSERRPFDSYQVDPTVENRVVLNDGQLVVSRGKFNDEYTVRGQHVRLGSLWTATLIKTDGRWQITSFHLSANAFDNPVISLRRTLERAVAGAIGVGAGLIAGLALGIWWARRRPRVSAA
jgi:ketosteroid isomerase-like protein